jgi:DNA repair exonuclease SbcCD ATPase subunit
VIRSIRLANWRAYRSLDLHLTRPVTFFVAPNGVGKTSLVEAVRWGLLGTPGQDRRRAVRIGSESATVQLGLSLPGYPDLQVTRTLKRTGSATFIATAGGAEITELQYEAILREAWSARPGLLDALIFGTKGTGKETGFPIRDHLADVFGIQPLLDAASQLKERRGVLAAKIKSIRDDLVATDEALAEADREIADLEHEVEAATAERSIAEARIGDLEVTAARADAWERYRHTAKDYDDRVRNLVVRMTDVLDVGARDPASALADEEREADAALEDSLAARAAAEVASATAANAADLLSAAMTECPTCLRPLSAAERDAALSSHGDLGVHARTEVERRDLETASVRRRLAVIAEFGRTLNGLQAPVEPENEDPGPAAAIELANARRLVSELAEKHGALGARLSEARRKAASLRQAGREHNDLLTAAREDAVAEVTQNSLNRVADHYLNERIQPLTQEISRRWKLVFGSDGLRFGPDGHLGVQHGDVELGLGDLSGGERATALLVTRLLLVKTLARASTIWFDEPLEHLDPRRRATIARTLLLAADAGAVDQVVVTTYEEGLARRLAAIAPNTVELTYARANKELQDFPEEGGVEPTRPTTS